MTNRTALPVVLLFIALVSAFMYSCKGGRQQDNGVRSMVIAEQYGLAYAPLQIARINGMLEKELPGWEIKWEKLVNTAAIREAMLSGNLDIGFMAIPPFLIGYGNGMQWKIFTGLSTVPVELVTWKDNINSLSDFSPEDRIALPQPGSIQHILLSMAAEKQLGDPRHFDNQLLTMAHPDGMNALIMKKDVAAHFTSPPFIMQELKMDGFKSVLKGSDAAGSDFTFAVGAVTDQFSEKHPEAVRALKNAISEASALLTGNPEKASQLLAPEYKTEEEEIYGYITWPGMDYGTEVKGTEAFSAFMKKSGYLKNGIDFSDIFFK